MAMPVTSRGLTRSTAAESHERFRLGYPDQVVDRTLAYAGRPVHTAVEVGAGTGKATRAFASRGVRVAALEPVPGMYAVLERETVGMHVEPVHASFEQYAGPQVDLVYAAASWHLTDPRTRWRRAADLLVDGGVLAVFGGRVHIADRAVHAAVSAIGRTALDDVTSRPRVDRLEDSGLFTDVESHEMVHEVALLHREYVGYLSTLPEVLELSTDERQQLLRSIADVTPDQVAVRVAVRLVLARRTGPIT
jgi:trans-aconitate methyltransferase